jgi:hypothetical protein
VQFESLKKFATGALHWMPAGAPHAQLHDAGLATGSPNPS